MRPKSCWNKRSIFQITATFCKIKIIFKSSTRLANFFRLEDKIPLCLCSNSVYVCRCNASYYGETCRHFKFRVGEHPGISTLRSKQSKWKKITTVCDHMFICDHVVFRNYFKVLASINSEFHLKTTENLLISRDQLILNKNETSLPLYLFD